MYQRHGNPGILVADLKITFSSRCGHTCCLLTNPGPVTVPASLTFQLYRSFRMMMLAYDCTKTVVMLCMMLGLVQVTIVICAHGEYCVGL